ncbi:MAG: hypothetical protein NUV57_01055 [archaeon]|nr:hypothetical protein [archaeon]
MKSISNILIAIILVLALSVVLFMPAGNASTNGFVLLTQNQEAIDSYFVNDKLNEEIIQEINENLGNVPEQLFELFGDNQMNIYVEFDNGSTKDYWAKTENGRLVQLFKDARSNADIEIFMKESTVDKIVFSSNPFDEFINAMNSGEIKTEAKTLNGHVKSASVGVTTTILGAASGVINFFGGFFG